MLSSEDSLHQTLQFCIMLTSRPCEEKMLHHYHRC